MQAIKALQHNPFRGEALRMLQHAGHVEITEHALERTEGALRHRAYMEAIKPWIDEKVRIDLIMAPSRLISVCDGIVTIGPPVLTEAARQALEGIDQQIDAIRRTFFPPEST